MRDRVDDPDFLLRAVSLRYTLSDLVDPRPTATLTVTSNEPVTVRNAVEFDLSDVTTPDWTISGARAVFLRAESARRGRGRVYTIAVTARDAAGNRAVKTVEVRVAR